MNMKLSIPLAVAVAIAVAGVSPAALVAHWPLDDSAGSGTVAESVQSFDGAPEGGVTQGVVDGTQGTVIELNGTDGRVNLSDHVFQLNTQTTGTITGWFNHGNTSIGAIFTLSDSTVGSTESRLFIENSRLRYDFRDGGGNPTGEGGMMASQQSVDDNLWHHFAVSIDGGAQVTNLYLDGIHVGQDFEPLWGDITDAANVLDTMAMGSNTDSGGNQWWYNGRLSNLAVYDNALSHGQVLDVMQNGVSNAPATLPTPGIRTSGVIAHYKFNELSPGNSPVMGASLTDETGNHAGEVLVDSLSYVAGPFAGDSALRFGNDGLSSNRVEVENDSEFYILPGESFTVESRFRTDTTGATMGLVAKNDSNGGEMWFRIESDGDVRFFVKDQATHDAAVRSDVNMPGQLMTDGAWHHAAGVYDSDAGEVRLYLDHQLVATDDSAPNTWASPIMGGDANLTFGDFYGTGSRQLTGDIDAVRISIEALTPDEFLPIPEPSSWLLIAWGVLGLGTTLRRRQRTM